MPLHPITRGTARLGMVALIVGLIGAGFKGRLARFEINEGSMEPALRSGDYIVAVSVDSYARGDIVVYRDPARSGRDLVKRVVGLPGETLSIRRGQIAIDGALLTEPWAMGQTHTDGVWSIPPETVFVVGDNRHRSAGDSRATGPVSIRGMRKVVLRYWPRSAVGRL